METQKKKNRRKYMPFLLACLIITGFGGFLFFSSAKSTSEIDSSLIEQDKISVDLSQAISYKDYANQSFQKIETEFIDFEMPFVATHYWRQGLDKYEIIIHNLSIKGYQDYVLKATWYDERFLDESFEIHYDFSDGVLDEKNITFHPLKQESGMTFQNKTFQLGTVIGERYELQDNNDCDSTKHEECLVNVSYPVYSWEDYSPIDMGDKLSFKAIDAIDVTSCGNIDEVTGEGIYILVNTTIVNFPDTCFTINISNVEFNGKGILVDGGDAGPSGVGISVVGKSGSVLTNVTIRNINISDFGDGITFNFVEDSFIINSSTSSAKDNGFQFEQSDQNVLTNLTATNNVGAGIQLVSFSSGNNFTGGSIVSNTRGIELSGNIDDNIFIGYTITDHTDEGVFLSGTNVDRNIFFNNFFNNSMNFEIPLSTDTIFNTTQTATPSIIGGANSGGNYWAFPNGTGHSETCTVSVTDNICDNPANASTSLECIGCTGVIIDMLPLSFETAGADSCSCPGSGDWNPVGGDNCVITANCDLQGNSLFCTEAGTFTVDGANITNWDDVYFRDSCKGKIINGGRII